MGKYCNPSRKVVDKEVWERVVDMVAIAKDKGKGGTRRKRREIYGGRRMRNMWYLRCNKEIAKVYAEVFPVTRSLRIPTQNILRMLSSLPGRPHFAIRRKLEEEKEEEEEKERRKENENENGKVENNMRKIVSLSAAEMDMDCKKSGDDGLCNVACIQRSRSSIEAACPYGKGSEREVWHPYGIHHRAFPLAAHELHFCEGRIFL